MVEEAALLDITIVASRRQVDIGGGYTGWDARGLVDHVRSSDSTSLIVRDHGGPLQGGKDDDGIESLDADVAAGFDRLHLDVCLVGNSHDTLHSLVRRYAGESTCVLEIGDEHAPTDVNQRLLDTALDAGGTAVGFGVVSTGSHVWADSQIGTPVPESELYQSSSIYRGDGVKTKAHNMDWLGSRKSDVYVDCIDEYNLAPEIGAVEIDAIIMTMLHTDAIAALNFAYESNLWHRWFNMNEGTWIQRAKCALRYLRTDASFNQMGLIKLGEEQEGQVRGIVRDALIAG